MFGWAGCLKQRLQLKWRDVLGAEIRADGSVCLVELREENGWQVDRRILLPPAAEGKDNAWQARRIAARLEEEGLQEIPLVLLADKKEVKDYLLSVPPGLKGGEQREAAYWELDARLGEMGLDMDDYAVVMCPLAQSTSLWGGVVRRDYLLAWQEAFGQAGVILADIWVAPTAAGGGSVLAGDMGTIKIQGMEIACGQLPEQLPLTEMKGALCAAVSFLQSASGAGTGGGGLVKRTAMQDRWNWPLISAFVVGLVAFLTCAVIGWDSWMLYVARHENWSAQQEMVRMASAQNKMKLLERMREETAGKEKRLQELSAKNISWYSVLVHLGSRTVEGVWLDRLEFEGRDKLRLAGRAASYEAVAGFLQAFEEDKDFFPQGPVLESSGDAEKQSPAQDGTIAFQMSIAL